MTTRNMGLDADGIIPTVDAVFMNSVITGRMLELRFSILDLSEDGLLHELLATTMRLIDRSDSY